VRRLTILIALCALLAFAGCGGDDDDSTTGAGGTTAAESTSEGSGEASTGGAEKTKPQVTVPKGAPPKQLKIEDVEAGSGAEAEAGDEVTVQYVGVNYKNGKEFDSSWSRNEPFTFTLGAGQVIPGWEQGVEGMKVGGRRELTIPPDLAYGETGSPPAIGPNETLIFVVDLEAVQ
jgi:peptidylprolyl isomerase